MDIATLADLPHETADHHDPYEKMAPKHDWWDWRGSEGLIPDDSA
jgi:hypothetical protein